jgi:hypothetical protein
MKPARGFAVGALGFLAVAVSLLAWNALVPGDQLILLSLLAIPADFLFFWLASATWGKLWQALAIGLLGMVQYGLLGYFMCLRSGARKVN